MSWVLVPPLCMKMLRVIPLLDKEGARRWLTGSIRPVGHHPLTPFSAEEGSYFHDRRNDGTKHAICLGTNCLLTNCLLDKEVGLDYSPVNYSFANSLGGEWRKA